MNFSINNFPKGWKAIYFNFNPPPKGFAQWVNALWGWDIWYYEFPVVKSLIATNILVWLIFIF